MKLLIKKGRVIDPSQKLDEVCDILIEKGKISSIGKNIKAGDADEIDANGKVVCPGFIDMHVHLREPGREDKETITTGTKAAGKGGFTSIACMPNTNPVIDNQGVVEYVISQAEKVGVVNVFPIGAVTKDQKGEDLSEIGELKDSGVVALSDDGNVISNAEIMRRALEYSKMFSLPVISHCEDQNLINEGVMNEGYHSTLLGLSGRPAVAESIMVQRDIALAEIASSKLHIAHITTAGGIELVRGAKKKGIRVTCETCPHYFSLTDEAVKTYDTNTKMQPPLRDTSDVDAVKKALKDGTIDVIATDHAPHTLVDKDVEYNLAAFGIVGLETAVSLVLDKLVKDKVIDIKRMVELMSINPAKILSLKGKGSLKEGSDADITIIDTEAEFVVDVKKFESKGKNTPFDGWKLKGKPVYTIVGGRIVMKEGVLSTGR